MTENNVRGTIEHALTALVVATRYISMYGEKHKLTKEAVAELFRLLEKALTEREEITIGIIGNEVVFEKGPFYETSKHITSFIKHLKELKTEKFSFAKGLEESEVAKFVTIISRKAPTEKEEKVEKAIESSDIRHIAVGKVGFKKATPKTEISEKDVIASAKINYERAIQFLSTTADDMRMNRPIDLRSARQLIGGIVGTLLKNKTLLLILASTKSHDESTFVHDINVSVFTLLQAETLGIEEGLLNQIGVAALLHDTGKLSVSGGLLRKKEKLSEGDKEKIYSHPVTGAKALLKMPGVTPLAAIAAFEHHIAYDMTGYPEKCFGKKVNFVSMMVMIADCYDALRSRRVYHEAVAPEKTYEDMVALSGKQFHPKLLNHFFSIVGVYPPGTLVELDTREIGLVVKESMLDIRRPQVEILYDKKGGKEGSPYIANLLEKDKNGDYKWAIVRSLSPSEKFKVPKRYL